MEFNKIIYETLKKTAVFTITADYIDDDKIEIMVRDLLEVIKINKDADREEEMAEYFLDAFDALNVEIAEKEAEDLARIIKWEYDEFLVGKFDTYRSIVGVKTPEHRIINDSEE
ncbi:hypothetical protein NGRA_2359 [Nosema granulosis]|uniref:Uncharacterized protein n=1 Tax=Nosema granulosis TaxID=83296 RepID=A0A9P6GX82_9MICR|nr:hypothetical protein NGRA_2359 [Nosema granulosis]